MKYFKITIICVALSLFANITKAQELQWMWATQGLGSGSDNVSGMVHDSLGNLYIAGNFTDSVSFGETILTAQGKNDIFLVKYTKDGKVIWAKSAGSTGNDYPSTLAISPDGNLYMAGMIGKEAAFDEKISGEKKQNLFIARYTTEGKIEWITAWQARTGDYITALAADSAGNLYCSGYFEKKLIIDNQHTIQAIGKSDAFAACFNSEGQTQWIKSWGGKGIDKITHIHISDNQLWMTGSCQLSMQIDATNITANESPAAFILRATTEGEIISAEKLAEGNDIHIAKIKPLANGSIAVGGSFSGSLKIENQTMQSFGNHDIFIALIDTSQNIVWQQQVGSYGFDKLYDIIEQPESGIVVTGIYSGVLFIGNDTTSFQCARADLFNLALDNEGAQQWISTTGGRTEQYPAALAQDDKGNIYVAGAFRDTLKIRRSTLSAPKGKYNVFFAKLHRCVHQPLTFICDTIFTEGTALSLQLNGNYETYRWDYGRSNKPTYKVNCSGTYRVSVTDSLKCVYRDSITVKQIPAPPVIQIRAQLEETNNQLYSTRDFALIAKLEED